MQRCAMERWIWLWAWRTRHRRADTSWEYSVWIRGCKNVVLLGIPLDLKFVCFAVLLEDGENLGGKYAYIIPISLFLPRCVSLPIRILLEGACLGGTLALQTSNDTK